MADQMYGILYSDLINQITSIYIESYELFENQHSLPDSKLIKLEKPVIQFSNNLNIHGNLHHE